MSNPFEDMRKTLKERTDVLLKSGQLSDCVFIVGENEEKIVAHKIFMAISSPAFYAMFFGDIAEKTDTVRIKDIDPAAFNGMLQYIYTDEVEFESCNHASMVYLAAKKYLLPYLEAQCEIYIKDNVEAVTACEVYEFAKFYGIISIEEVCLKLFQNSTEEVINSQSFVDSDYQTILLIVKSENLNVSSELLLFKAVEKWAINEANRRGIPLEELSSEMNEIISSLRFLSLTADEFTASQVNMAQGLTPLLTTEEQLAIVMNITNPGIRPLPKRISTDSSPRRPKPPPVPEVPFLQEWSLTRECQDVAQFPVTKWSNPFTRKGMTVSRKIKIKGVKIGTQRRPVGVTEEAYQEKVTVVLKRDWAMKFFGSLYHSITPYDSEIQVNFSKPVILEAGKLYWLIVSFDKGGTYSFMRDTNVIYNGQNIEIKFSEDFSAVTEIFFIENDNEDNNTVTSSAASSSSSSCLSQSIPGATRAIAAPPPPSAPSQSASTSNQNPAATSPSNSSSPSLSPTSPKL